MSSKSRQQTRRLRLAGTRYPQVHNLRKAAMRRVTKIFMAATASQRWGKQNRRKWRK